MLVHDFICDLVSFSALVGYESDTALGKSNRARTHGTRESCMPTAAPQLGEISLSRCRLEALRAGFAVSLLLPAEVEQVK